MKLQGNHTRGCTPRVLRAYGCAVALALFCASSMAWGQSQFSGLLNAPAFTNTPHQVREGSAALVGAYNPASKLRVAISIKAPRIADEEMFLMQLKDRNSPNFHKYLTPEQWNARFAPSAQDEQAVVDWVNSHGLAVTARYPNRLMVNAEGTVDAIQKAFNIKINHYQVNGQVEFSNDRDPEIPENLKGIVEYVDGLNSIVRMRPANSRMHGVRGPDYAPGPMHQIGQIVHRSADKAATRAIKASSHQVKPPITNGFYDPTDFWSQEGYNYNALQAQGHCCNPLGNPGQTPPETTIGLATDGDFADSDIVGFQAQYPYLAYHYGRVFVDGTPSGGDDETTLDLEWTTATSNSEGAYQNTSLIWVYEAAQGFGDFGTLFQQMVTDNNVRVVNISYGLSETVFVDDAPGLLTSWHATFNQMIGQGWTIMASAGDSGSDAGCTGSLAVIYPESDPDVTSVGGTELFLNGDGSFNTEVAWTGGTSPGSCSVNNGGGGGGCSAVWAAPGYQVNPYCGTSSRSVPDVSLNAGVGTNFFFNGSLSGVGGTSLSSPLMSGFIAQENAYSLSMGNACDGTHNCAPIGQVDYDIYAEGGYNMSAPHYPFYDITSGCTTNDTIAVGWCAASGYDLATGWGSFNALQMAWAINWEDNLSYNAPSVAYSGPAINTWYNSDQVVSWGINANSNPTGIAGFTQGWDSIPSDPFSDTDRNDSNSFFSGPQFPNATTGCLELAGGGGCAGGVSQGCHTAHVRAWSNQGSTSGDVTYGPICYDTVAPVTTAALNGTKSGAIYISAVKDTLSATDPSPGSGLASTVYQINGGTLHAYSAPFTLSANGNYTVTFHSTDVAGNIEATKSVSFIVARWLAETSGITSQLRGISCVTQNLCEVVGAGGTILGTSNGGNTWTKQTSGTTTQLNGVSCVGLTFCVAVGNAGKVLVTTNEGGTWTSKTSGTTNNLNGVSCASTTVCIAAGSAGKILVTTNGGGTWTSKTSGTTDNLNAISCSSTTNCTAVGAAGTIRSTTNGGGTWTGQTSGTTSGLTGVACFSGSKVCETVGVGGIIIGTTNGGTTWNKQTSGTTTGLNSVSCTSTLVCRAVGGNGIIQSTSNGGASWTTQPSGSTQALFGVNMRTVSEAYVVGNSGTILKQ